MPASSPPSAPSTPLSPLSTLPHVPSQAMRIAHPALLAAVFVSTFRTLVADPPAAMRLTLPATAAVQAAYAMVCLPPAGRQGKNKGKGPSVVVTTLVALALSLLAAPAIHALFILFGAPLLALASHTALLAAHASLLALFPTLYSRGVDGCAWHAVAACSAPVDEVFGGLVGAGVGAWLGAVPIPLDWDREWQRWPVTVLVGMGGGYVLGKALGGTVAFGTRLGVGTEKGEKTE